MKRLWWSWEAVEQWLVSVEGIGEGVYCCYGEVACDSPVCEDCEEGEGFVDIVDRVAWVHAGCFPTDDEEEYCECIQRLECISFEWQREKADVQSML